jgi:dephospho-CoA kinase
LRHPLDFESLKNTFDKSFFMVYIDTLREIRFERLRDRYATFEQFLAADSHPVEARIQELVPFASATLNGTEPISKLGPKIDQLVRDFRAQSEAL